MSPARKVRHIRKGSIRLRLTMNFETLVDKVENPVLDDAIFGVERNFDLAVNFER